MKVTMRQIAEIAGVSRGTVDKVLNDRPGVSAPVRAKVKRVADSLNYKPNLIGKALAGQNNQKKIGVIIAPDYNPFVKDIKQGVKTAAMEISDYGFNIDVRVLPSLEDKDQIDILDSFVEKGVEAISMFCIDSDKVMQKVNEITDFGIPVVTYNSDLAESKRMCYIGQDHIKGGRVAADLMAKVLDTDAQVFIITSLKTLDCHRDRLAGFETCIREYGSGIKVLDIIENEDKEKTAYDATLKMLKNHPGIKGIYITGGGVGGVCDALKELGREKSVRVICHDLVEKTVALLKEGIVDFTIGQDPFFQGYQPIKILFEYLIAGKKPEYEFIRTRVDIQTRSTV